MVTDNTARLWDAETGKVRAVLKGHENAVNCAAFTPDGTSVVTASDDKTARLWDAETGNEIALLAGHDDKVNCAAFSPDGTRVLTASSDGTARVWDAATGAEIAMLKGHKVTINSAAFSPDGTRLVTSSYDNTARVWDMTKQEKGDGFAIACLRLGKNTDLADVRARYGLGEITPICGEYQPLPVDRHQVR
jgi:WD40 repeat protein